MKAVGLYRYLPIDDPESFLDLEIDTPVASGHDLLVEVKAISVNPVDAKRRAPKDLVEKNPRVLGWDAAGVRLGSRIVDQKTARTALSPAAAFAPIRRIGGKNGWYFANFLWRIRSFIDLLVSGVGLRRGRRNPEYPAVGDALDFWRVEAYEPDRRLRLFAEMKVPGRACSAPFNSRTAVSGVVPSA